MIHRYHHLLSKIFFFTGTLFFLSVGALIFVKELSEYIPQRWKDALQQKDFHTFHLSGIKIYKNELYDPAGEKQAENTDFYGEMEEAYSPDWRVDFRDNKDNLVYLSYEYIKALNTVKPIDIINLNEGAEMELPDDVLEDNFDCIFYQKEVPVARFRNINFRKMMTDKDGRQKKSFKITSEDGKVVGYIVSDIIENQVIVD